jgi:3-oxoacyl-[acyl-carrier-protein] synthase II
MAWQGQRRVVVTGMGAITPVGHTVSETWAAFIAGQSGSGPVTLFDASIFPTRIAAEVKDFDPGTYIPPKEARRMSRCAQFAVIAAREAVTDACLDWAAEDMERVGVILGTAGGGLEVILEPLRKFYTEGTWKILPYVGIEMLSNVPAFHVGQENGCLGPLSTVVTSCAAGTQAIGDATSLIRRGITDVMLAGGTEAQLNLLSFASFSALRALSTRNDDPQRASRPFDGDRDGVVFGEGSGVVVLEELGHAVRRGARIYAEVFGSSVSADAYHPVAPDPEAKGPIRAMRWALADAGLPPEAIDYINAHGSSTVANDSAETYAIKQVFGDHAHRLCISGTKSMVGHCLGAAGGIEAIATIMSVATNMVHPTINHEHPDPLCDLDYVPNVARQRTVDIAMSNSFGFGGQNACLVFAKPDYDGVFATTRGI